LFAQNGSILGSIIDENNSEPIPFATVALMQGGSALSVGSVSDASGNFEIQQLPAGTYDVIVSFIGFSSTSVKGVEISRQAPMANIGTISIAVSNVQLDEVEVSAMASTSSTKIDRRAYRAEDFKTARGGTAVDILNKLPSVSVSPDGEVSVRGTTDFMVYLNGKPTQLDPSVLLGQISSDAVDQVEVITVPTAKYDAQGKGGIINISTKTRGQEGLTILANGLGGGAPWGHTTDSYSGYKMNDYRYGANVNMLYSKEKISAYAGLSYSMRNVNGERFGDARILDTARNVYKHMVADGERPEWYENYSANTGFDYQISDRSQISGSYYYGSRTEGRSAFYVYNVYYADKDKNTIGGIPRDESYIYNPNTDNRYGTFHTLSLDYNYAPDPASELNVSVLVEKSGLNRILDNHDYAFDPLTDTPGAVLEHFNQTDDTPLSGYQFHLDYQKTFDGGHTIGVGIQPQLLSIDGSFSYDTLGVQTGEIGDYTSLENSINLKRNIYAGYLNYEGSWDKLSVIAGLRLEYTDQLMQIANPDYFTIFDRATQSEYEVQQLDWFPVFHAGYSLGKDRIVLAASRRISRPPIKNMAPFLYRRHHEVYVLGDPGLKPEYITSAELSYDKDLGKHNVVLTGFYRAVDNAVFRVNTIFAEQMVLIRSYTNSGESQSLGAEINSNFELGKKAKFFLGASLYNYRIQGEVFGYYEDNSSTNWNVKGVFNLMPGKQLKWSTDFNIQSATVTAQGNNTMFYFLNTAISYQAKKISNWSFTFKVLDIFGSNAKGLDTRAFNANEMQIFFQETMYHRYGPIAELSLSYAFNSSGKSKKQGGSTFGTKEF
jgi:outer membrane receptor protein involved in Fe transport